MCTEDAKIRPFRPSISPLVWVALTLWGGIWVGQWLQWEAYCGRPLPVEWVVLCAALLVPVVAMLVRTGRLVAVVCVLALFAGATLGWLQWGVWARGAAMLSASAPTQFQVEVLGDESVSDFGSSSECRLLTGAARGARVVMQWPEGAVPPLGSSVSAYGHFKAAPVDARGARLSRDCAVGYVRARALREVTWAPTIRGALGPLRLWASRKLGEVPGAGGALLAGVVLGDRRRLAGTEADTDFRTTGLTHVVAVSGSHLVVVAAVAGWLLGMAGLGRVPRGLGVALVVGAYVVLSGVQPSAVRAWVMAVSAATAWAVGRRTDGGSVLAVAAGGILLTAPSAAFDLGFQLSVAAVAGLVFLGRLVEEWACVVTGRRLEWLAAPVALTLAATLATAPITVGVFGMLSLVSPLANVIVGPLVSGALVGGLLALAGSALSGALGAALLKLASLPAHLSVWVAHRLASLPFAAVATAMPWTASAACLCAAALVWAIWPSPTRFRARVAAACIGVACVGLAIGPPAPRGLSITMLDVGQGDAILLRDGGRSLLVDAGPSSGAMREGIARAGVRRLDALVVTHLHADHYGGMGGLAGVVDVGAVFAPEGALDAPSDFSMAAAELVGEDDVSTLRAGRELVLGATTVRVLWPMDSVDDPAENSASVVLLVRRGTFECVLTGDAESDVLDTLVGSAAIGDVDVLKVGHHGSRGAASPESLRIMSPLVALISVGAGNRFGHPTPEMLSLLQAAHARIIRTDESGDVTLHIADDGTFSVTADGRRANGAAHLFRRVIGAPIDPLCAKLIDVCNAPYAPPTTGVPPRGKRTQRLSAGVSVHQRTRAPPRQGVVQAQAGCRQAGRSRFQLRDVRR
ncbi:MAG: DNA internalization-related competence protein ComEC/Rec2 [Coriobacteriia bacterium]|nr:DNA internalization-related competence protein ComEC/Rec2 [Coriobacteriia bacterium]